MSSKKIRNKIRMKRIKLLCPKAMQLYAKSEEDRLYLEGLKDLHLTYGMNLSDVKIAIHMLQMKYFGYANSLFQEWWMGFTKYKFAINTNGKIRAKDITISEIQQ